MIWDFFDKVYCISLDNRQDRRIQAENQFMSVGLAGKAEFVIVRKHPSNSEQGIYESHVMCIRKGISENAKNILVFEDDIVFDGFRYRHLSECIEFLSTDTSWKIFFFGCLIKGSRKTKYPSVLKIKYRCLAHAYVINRTFAETVSCIRWNGTPFDDLIASCKDGMYMIRPSFAFQRDSSTNNDKLLRLDKTRRLFGGLKQIQKMNLFYHYHKPVIIALHLAVIMVILGFIF